MDTERTKQVIFRCNEREYNKIKADAEKVNLDISKYARARLAKDYRTLRRSRNCNILTYLTEMEKNLNKLEQIISQTDFQEDEKKKIRIIREELAEEENALWQIFG